MNDLQSLTSIADELDSAGMHAEAGMLDKVLQKTAILLELKEKPFLAKLANIMLVLANQRPGTLIRGTQLAFPSSGKRLVGLTREEALDEVRRHLEAFIEQYLMPTFEAKYVNTRHEEGYRTFIENVRGLALLMESLFSGKTSKERVRDGLSALNQTRKMFNMLLVNQRVQKKTRPDFPDATNELTEGLDVLTELQIAVQKLDERATKTYTRKLQAICPSDLDDQSDLFQLVYLSYPTAIPFIQQGVIEREVEERLSEDQLIVLRDVIRDIKKNEKVQKSLYDVYERLGTTQKRFDTVKAQAESEQQQSVARIQSKPKMPAKEFRRRRRTMPEEIFREPRLYGYIRPSIRLDAIERDVEALEEWLQSYQNHQANTWLTFSQFLSRGSDPRRLDKITKKIQTNMANLERIMTTKIRTVRQELDSDSKKRWSLMQEKNQVEARVTWDMWHHEYIDKLVEMLNLVLTPEISLEGTSIRAFKRTLREFQDLLSYRL